MVGDRTHPCVTLLSIGRQKETDPSTIIAMDLFDRKQSRREQIEGGKSKESSLESNDLFHALLNALEISWATIKDLPKSLRADGQREVTWKKISPVDLAFENHTDDQLKVNFLLSVIRNKNK